MNYNATPWFSVPDLPKAAPKAVPKMKRRAKNKTHGVLEEPPPASPQKQAEASPAQCPHSDLPDPGVGGLNALNKDLIRPV